MRPASASTRPIATNWTSWPRKSRSGGRVGAWRYGGACSHRGDEHLVHVEPDRHLPQESAGLEALAQPGIEIVPQQRRARAPEVVVRILAHDLRGHEVQFVAIGRVLDDAGRMRHPEAPERV